MDGALFERAHRDELMWVVANIEFLVSKFGRLITT